MEQDLKLTQDVRDEMERHLASVADALRRSGTAENEVQSVLQDLRNHMMELLTARVPQPPTLRDVREVIAGMAPPESYAETPQLAAKAEPVPASVGPSTLPDDQKRLLMVCAFVIIFTALAMCLIRPYRMGILPPLLGVFAGLLLAKWSVKGSPAGGLLTGGRYPLSDAHIRLLTIFGVVLILAGLVIQFVGWPGHHVALLLAAFAGLLFVKWAVKSAAPQRPAATSRPGVPEDAPPSEGRYPLSDAQKRLLMIFGFVLILAALISGFALRQSDAFPISLLAGVAGLLFVRWAIRGPSERRRLWAWSCLVVVALLAIALLFIAGSIWNWGWGRSKLVSWLTPDVVQGSGHVITETRTAGAFSRVYASGISVLNITQGEPQSLTVEADDNILPLIETEVNGDKLRIGYKLGKWSGLCPAKPVTVNVTMKQVSELEVSGGIRIHAGSVAADELGIRGAGAMELTIDALSARTLKVDASGSAECDITGKVERQGVHGSGAIRYSAGRLESQSAEVDISGSANVTVWATENLDVRASGSGDVSYYGKPRVTEKASGSCKIKSLGNP